MGKKENKKDKKKTEVSLETPLALKIPKKSIELRREGYRKLIKEYIELIVAADYRQRTGHVDDFIINEVDDFPTLQVGYLARAVGLNISNSQVLDIVSLVENDDLSGGYVLQDRLMVVLVDALMTGMIGGPTLYKSGLIPPTRSRTVSATYCIRETERHIFRAFRTLDRENKGFLTEDELRAAMLESGDGFTEEEMEEMLLAAVDPDSGNIYYRTYADVLARE